MVVQGLNKEQPEKIEDYAEGVTGLRDKLNFWDHKEILDVHENLEYVNKSINQMGFVPDRL